MQARYRIGVRAAGFASLLITATGCPLLGIFVAPTENIGIEWMELTLDALEQDTRMPTVEARTLWHVSAAMYEAWAAYSPLATGYFTGDTYDQPPARQNFANTAETLSHAVYRVLTARFAALGQAPEGSEARRAFEALAAKMRMHGYLTAGGDPVPSPAQELGAMLGDIVLAYAATDGANEANDYADTSGYVPSNRALVVERSGTNGMRNANGWQPLKIGGVKQTSLTPHWGEVEPFALPPHDPDTLRMDPGPPPLFGENTEPQFVEEMMECLRFVASMDPDKGLGKEMINLSPGVRGQFVDGSFEGDGHPVNPHTGEAYADHIVPLGDFLRVQSVFLDGYRFTTPAPWWNELTCEVLRGEGSVGRRPANKPRAADLEYDVKLFFTLNGALHDAAIAVWDVKRVYDSCRPISGIRYLAEIGQLPLEPGLVEIIQPGDPLAGPTNENVGKVKVKGWAGPDGGVRWMLGADWVPYQPVDFVTPPFPGYTSGHTAFGRAFAEVMTLFTGDPYFPGGLFELPVSALKFESDLSTTVELQAATYHDLAYDAGFARVFSGVHIAADVFGSQPIGEEVGRAAFFHAQEYFQGVGTPVED